MGREGPCPSTSVWEGPGDALSTAARHPFAILSFRRPGEDRGRTAAGLARGCGRPSLSLSLGSLSLRRRPSRFMRGHNPRVLGMDVHTHIVQYSIHGGVPWNRNTQRPISTPDGRERKEEEEEEVVDTVFVRRVGGRDFCCVRMVRINVCMCPGVPDESPSPPSVQSHFWRYLSSISTSTLAWRKKKEA